MSFSLVWEHCAIDTKLGSLDKHTRIANIYTAGPYAVKLVQRTPGRKKLACPRTSWIDKRQLDLCTRPSNPGNRERPISHCFSIPYLEPGPDKFVCVGIEDPHRRLSIRVDFYHPGVNDKGSNRT